MDLIGVAALLTSLGGLSTGFIAVRQSRLASAKFSSEEAAAERLADREDFEAVTKGLRELADQALAAAKSAEEKALSAEAEASGLRTAVTECHRERAEQQLEIVQLRHRIEKLEAAP